VGLGACETWTQSGGGQLPIDVWSRPAAGHFFEILKLRFGPYAEWGHAFMPGRGRNHEFNAFCKNVAIILGTTPDDVKQQIRIAAARDRSTRPLKI